MKRSLVCFFALLVLVFAQGCRVEDGPTPSGPHSASRIDVSGVVLDENDRPLSGVTVTSGGKNVQTNEVGAFYMRDITATNARVAVTFYKDGYYVNGKASPTRAGSLTAMRVKMERRSVAGQVSASTGGSVALAGSTAKVELPAQGIVDKSGARYNGQVNVSMQMMMPSEDDFNNLFPGDMAASRTDGSATTLYTLGVLRVELNAPNGDQLNLAPGQKATITAPIDPSQQAFAPESVPLWYYDTDKGLWIEYGVAAKRGNLYVGEVPHFTPINIDVPIEPSTITGRVVCGSKPMAGIWVRVGSLTLLTDDEGNFRGEVGAIPGSRFSVKVFAADNGGMSSQEVVVSDLRGRETRFVEVAVSNCPGTLEGTLLDCEGGLASGMISVTVNSQSMLHFVREGRFSIPASSGGEIVLRIFAENGGFSHEVTLPAINADQTRALGNIRVCAENPVETGTYPLIGEPEQLAVNFDGSLIALLRRLSTNSNVSEVRVIRTSDGSTVWMQNVVGLPRTNARCLMFSGQGNRILVLTSEVATIFDVANGVQVSQVESVQSAALSPDGSVMFATRNNSQIESFNVVEGRWFDIASVPGSDGWNWPSDVEVCGARTDGLGAFVKVVYGGVNSSTTKVWDLTNSRFPRELGSISGSFTARDLSADGSEVMLLEGTRFGGNSSTGSRIAILRTSEKRVYEQSQSYRSSPSAWGSAALANDNSNFVLQIANNSFGLFDYRSQALTKGLNSPADLSRVVWSSADGLGRFIAVITESPQGARNLTLYKR